MAKTRKRSVMEKKAKKKRWVPILAPEMFNRAIVGEIPLTSAEAAQGRVLTANLMNITHDIKQQNITVSLQIYEVKENQAFTKINSFKVMPTAIKRMTHRRMEIIEDSSIFITLDNVRVRIKPMLFTRGNTSNPVKRALRKGMRNLILRTVKQSKVEELFRNMLSNKLQYAIIKELSKLHPVKHCVIRELSIEQERTRRKKAKAVETEVDVPKTRKALAKEEEQDLDQGIIKPKKKEPVLVAGVELEPPAAEESPVTQEAPESAEEPSEEPEPGVKEISEGEPLPTE